MGLADDLLEDARHLASRGIEEGRNSCLRRSVSTAYYAVFHLFVEEFVLNWPIEEERFRLARMFDHKKMREAAFRPQDEKNPTQLESSLNEVKEAFRQLQADRHRADYDKGWQILATDAQNGISLAEEVFEKWMLIRESKAARSYLLSMFGANR